jgi:hypothetical protein
MGVLEAGNWTSRNSIEGPLRVEHRIATVLLGATTSENPIWCVVGV